MKINHLKAIVAQFQEETKSNSILDFCVWIENREELNKLHMEIMRK